ncbi:hypothetical protein RvY_13800-4 [Ramazzottius varieornatus]|uniref:BTB domain-containing protein n=1 Tax=Ramazzottius varieornatus TaxID=947166 RepID=A0A1D1VXN0_RAMVA|nr:hypothetical protein RvY_13800-4 [Ramazzottius varieornatus]
MERRADTPWQNDVNTVASMVQALLLKNEFCDVVFQVGTDGETEQIKSHRALLAARSSVFATMFFGSVPENKAFVEVTDTSPDIFKLMLKFVYSDDTAGINVRNLIDMYGVAHKYDIIPLKKFCADQVKNCISMETVGEFLEMVLMSESAITDCLVLDSNMCIPVHQKPASFLAVLLLLFCRMTFTMWQSFASIVTISSKQMLGSCFRRRNTSLIYRKSTSCTYGSMIPSPKAPTSFRRSKFSEVQ